MQLFFLMQRHCDSRQSFLNILVYSLAYTSSPSRALTRQLAELCKEKPAGLEAVRYLGQWLLDNNPNQPAVQEPE